MLIQATEKVINVGETKYVGANPEYFIAPPNPAMGIMHPEVIKTARGRPFVKVTGHGVSRRERRAVRNGHVDRVLN